MQTSALRAPFAALALAVATLACGGAGPGDEPQRPWVRLDLWRQPPAVERLPLGAPEELAVWEARIGHLGAQEVRDRTRLNERDLAAIPQQPAGRVRVLAQRAGSRLAWAVEVPDDAYLSLVPLGYEPAEEPAGCPCIQRAGVRDADGVVTELYSSRTEAAGAAAPARAEIDLTAYAGSRVELLLQVDPRPGESLPGEPDDPPWVLWASPALYGRTAGAGGEPAGGRGEGPPNVLLLGLDTLRADAVGPRAGGAPSLTPALDRLAAESDVWTETFSTFNATNPSFASIFTGLYGKHHGVHDLYTPLAPEHQTLAELFAAAGYDTLAVISARHLGDRSSGLGQGFSDVVTSERTFAAELAVEHAMEWLGSDSADSGREAPWLAWVHLFDPHTPHTPPQPYALGLRPAESRRLQPVAAWSLFRQPGPLSYVVEPLAGHKDLYDGEVAYLDRQIDRLLGFLASRGLLDDTVVAVVADHGESLGEHGILYRHAGLYDTTTHVPLMIRWPERLLPGEAWQSRRGRRIGGLVQTLDLFPTLLAVAGIEAPPSDGIDLTQLTGEDRRGRRAVFAEHANHRGAMVRTERWKYMERVASVFQPEGPALFDLERDPLETVNLAGRGLPEEERLAALLAAWMADATAIGPGGEADELSEEDRARLRALGYL